MSTQIQIISMKQQAPFSAAQANVEIHFKIVGTLPDIVQVYAAENLSPNNKGAGTQAMTVLKDPKMTTDCQLVIPLKAGMWYIIYLCPRNVSAGNPDDQYDGEYWEQTCASRQFITQTVSPSGANESYPAPTIVGAQPSPATLGAPNRIVVSWTAARAYDKYVVGWTENGIEHQPVEPKESPASPSGSWTFSPTTPGALYTFHVNGGVSQFWNYTYSQWGPTVSVRAATNVTSLRMFLELSGKTATPIQLSALMAPGGSLRGLMQL